MERALGARERVARQRERENTKRKNHAQSKGLKGGLDSRTLLAYVVHLAEREGFILTDLFFYVLCAIWKCSHPVIMFPG